MKPNQQINLLKYLALVFCLVLTGCSSELDAVRASLKVTESKVNLKQSFTEGWDRVCVLGPYTTPDMAKAILGFDYNTTVNSNIYSSDSISLLITIKAGAVVNAYEINRKNADFTPLSGKCFDHEDSVFFREGKGHPYVSLIK